MKQQYSVLALSGFILATGSVAATNAFAATNPRVLYGNSASICQGALPSFDTAIRKRPLAVQNESASTVFVTCAFLSQGALGASTNNPTQVTLWFNTNSGADTVINCTGVSGFHTSPNQFIVKAITAPASGARTVAFWNAADFDGAPANFPSGAFSVSCSLPAGAAIDDVRVSYEEEIGA